MRRIFHIMSLLLGLLCQSCEHKELCLDHTHDRVPVSVEFDWRHAPGASPASMSLYLFPVGGGAPLRYEFLGRDAEEISVPAGCYDAIALNSDSEAYRLRNTASPSTFELYLRDAEAAQSPGLRALMPPRAPGTESERMALSPDAVWTACVQAFVADCGSGRVPKLTLELRPAVCRYSLEVRGVVNMERAIEFGATLSGMSGSLLPWIPVTGSGTVTLGTTLRGAGPGRLGGELLTFGHCAGTSGLGRAGDGAHMLVVYAVLSDGSRWYSTRDVTTAIHGSPGPDCHIVVDGLSLPDEQAPGGGFSPEVGEWQRIDIDIEM